MSRIGNKLISIPDKVKVQINGQNVKVEGPKGKLEFEVHPRIGAVVENNNLALKRKGETRQEKALHGLTRSILNKMVQG